MIFNRRSKCAGCIALLKGLTPEGEPLLSCKLGFEMSFKVIEGDAVQPVPEEPCYKPMTEEEYAKAEVLSDKRKNRGA